MSTCCNKKDVVFLLWEYKLYLDSISLAKYVSPGWFPRALYFIAKNKTKTFKPSCWKVKIVGIKD